MSAVAASIVGAIKGDGSCGHKRKNTMASTNPQITIEN
jgi:hypothetical protein